MKRLTMIVLVALMLVAPFATLAPPKQADAYVTDLEQCIRKANTWENYFVRKFAILSCKSNHALKGPFLNVDFAASSDGYVGGKLLDIVGFSSVTVQFDFPNGDPTSIELFLVNAANNPAAPNFGLSVGTDNAAPWAITFNPDIGGVGPWDGALLVEATGLPEHNDNVIQVIRDPSISESVGGIAELPEVAGTPLDAPASSGSNTSLLAGIVAAIAAGTVTLGGAACYARRRITRS